MQKIKIALCDKDKFYCERFAAYMMNHKAQEIELNIYSTIEQFTGDEKMGNFDLVIAGSGFEEFSSDVNIMYLSDLCGNQAAEEAMWEKDTIPQKKIVTKYQPKTVPASHDIPEKLPRSPSHVSQPALPQVPFWSSLPAHKFHAATVPSADIS